MFFITTISIIISLIGVGSTDSLSFELSFGFLAFVLD